MNDAGDNGSDRTTDETYDVAVIGLGSAGELLATQLASKGRRVIGFESGLVGGECPFVACMPSKAMLHDAVTGRDWDQAVARRSEIVNGLDDSEHASELVDAGVELVRAHARLTGPRRLEADGRVVEADHVVIATGAAASTPPIDGLDHPEVWTSQDALTATERPERLLVIGAGAIGCEASEMFARLGTAVVLVEQASQLIGDVEPEVSEIVRDALVERGIDVRLDSGVEAVEHDGGVVRATLDDGSQLTVDRVLVATGVTPRWDDLGLDAAGVEVEASEIARDGSVADTGWLWAIGDVTPQSHWTHGANAQAERLAGRLVEGAWPDDGPLVMPRAVFTHPPAATVGMTSADATARGHHVVVGRATFDDVARTVTDELGPGRVSVVVDQPTGRLLGASMAGARCDDVVHTATALMVGRVGIVDAARMVFAFPTVSQVLEAALADAASQLRTSGA